MTGPGRPPEAATRRRRRPPFWLWIGLTGFAGGLIGSLVTSVALGLWTGPARIAVAAGVVLAVAVAWLVARARWFR